MPTFSIRFVVTRELYYNGYKYLSKGRVQMEFLVFILIVFVGYLLYLLVKTNKKTKETETQLQQVLESSKRVNDADAYCSQVKAEVEGLNNQKIALKNEIRDLEKDLVVESAFVDEYTDIRSDEIKNKLALLRNKQKDMIKQDKALIVTSTEKKQVVNKQKQQILRCFNTECNDIIGKVTVKNIDTSRNKLTKSFDTINKIFEVDGVQIAPRYLETKYDELSLVFSYMKRLEKEAEDKRIHREVMIQEEKARRDYERAKQQYDKDIKQTQNEVNKLMKYMQKSQDDIEKQLYIDKIRELEAQINDLKAAKEDVENRERNAQAGYVYIISNIGSFGENVYKIGMTRRLEPMDRIKELSSASVPFVFDVHALIFSDNAPALETTLHHYFEKQRVNKINNRKEFFRVDLEEIKKVVLENHNATVNFVDIPDAVEYRETLKLEGKTRPVEVHYSESKGIQEEPTEEPGVKPVSAVASSTTSTLFEEPAQRPVKAKPVKIKPKKIGVVRPQA